MNCLRPGHIQKDCISSNCKHCGRKHNSLIHTNEREANKVNHDHGVANDTSNSETIATTAMAGQSAQVLLATAVICLKNRAGNTVNCRALLDSGSTSNFINCRALLDSGSTSNFITKALAQKLKLDTTNTNVPIVGVNNTNTAVSSITDATITSCDGGYNYKAWREQPQDELKYYRLNTVTYGTAPASFLAVRALHQAAMDNGADPRVINIIKSDFYMDDLITRSSWQEFHAQLSALNNIKIARQRYNYTGFVTHASERAYGACVYIRSTDTYGNHCSDLLCAKSRVAPLKRTSLPRLELCGAVLLSRLVRKVCENFRVTFGKRRFWCDSTIALAWIRTESVNWKTFVANRVAEVRESSLPEEWKHIPSALNPADIVSRGTSPEQLSQTTLWWHGPEFLKHNEELWPEQHPIVSTSDSEAERKKPIPMSFTTVSEFNIFDRFSSLSKLLRVVAFMLRFVHNARSKNDSRLRGELSRGELDKANTVLVKLVQSSFFGLSRGELDKANTVLVKLVQSSFFGLEINLLKMNKQIPRASKILSLDPFVDTDGLLRVGGRLRRSQIPYDRRHPLLLPSNHNFTIKIIEHEHIRNVHAGTQTVLAAVRRNFWPIHGKSTVKRVMNTSGMYMPEHKQCWRLFVVISGPYMEKVL
ncbi:Pao retrotransposon peptidase [Popillia japonica]|uniref:Pao retrotransposon peptidase n=1 Tax=Popillia japonica TaxID=7064 RepID=A0AAW1KNT1_POPJA